MARRSSYRLGRRLRAGYRGVLDFIVYLSSVPGGLNEGGLPAPAPHRFQAADWSVVKDGATGATVTVTALPISVAPITSIDYRIDGGEWVMGGIFEPGTFDVTGLTTATEYDIELRAVAEQPGIGGDLKTFTTD